MKFVSISLTAIIVLVLLAMQSDTQPSGRTCRRPGGIDWWMNSSPLKKDGEHIARLMDRFRSQAVVR